MLLHSCITISGGRTEQVSEQLDIIVGFLPLHWLYKWFSQFHSCGTYSVLSWSHSIDLCLTVARAQTTFHYLVPFLSFPAVLETHHLVSTWLQNLEFSCLQVFRQPLVWPCGTSIHCSACLELCHHFFSEYVKSSLIYFLTDSWLLASRNSADIVWPVYVYSPV